MTLASDDVRALTVPRFANILGVPVAAGLLLRLGGYGSSWLPRPGFLFLVLLILALGARVTAKRPDGGWIAVVRAHAFATVMALVLLLALATRLPNLSSDLGHIPIDIDENRLAANVRHFFVTGVLLHDTVEHYPGLVFWLFSAASLVAYVSGVSGGLTLVPAQLPVEMFVRSTRLANVIVGAGIVLVTGLIGRRLFGGPVGLIAAALVAIVPVSVETTTVVRSDPGMVLLVMMAVYLSLASLDDDRDLPVIFCGVLAGIATAIKYSGVFAIVPALIAAVARGTGRARVSRAAKVLLGFVVAIAITNHFVWADFPNFLRQLADQVSITGSGHWAATDNPAAFYVMILDRFGPGFPLIALSAGFAVYGLTSANLRYVLFLSFPLLYVWFMTQRPSQFPRWVFPVVPFVSIAGVAALASLIRLAGSTPIAVLARHRLAARIGAFAIAALVLWPPAKASVIALSRRVMTPTHVLTETWIREHAGAGSVVVAEQGWLDFRDIPVVIKRVRSLTSLLDEGVGAFAGANWVIVPEQSFGHPTLKRLGFVQQFHARPSFGGNLGFDFEIYRVPAIPSALAR